MPRQPISSTLVIESLVKGCWMTFGNAFVKQYLQLESPSFCSVSCENLRTASACSRLTLGKFSRNSSSDTPALRLLKSASTGTRVPSNTGVPLTISGLTLIGRDEISSSSITTVIASTSLGFYHELAMRLVAAGQRFLASKEYNSSSEFPH